MASIWIEAAKGKPEKLVGRMPVNTSLVARFKVEVSKAAKRFAADVVYQDDMNALLQPRPKSIGDVLTKFHPIAMWVEPMSPPSAPETNQPKLMENGTKGLLVTKRGAFEMGVPK